MVSHFWEIHSLTVILCHLIEAKSFLLNPNWAGFSLLFCLHVLGQRICPEYRIPYDWQSALFVHAGDMHDSLCCPRASVSEQTGRAEIV